MTKGDDELARLRGGLYEAYTSQTADSGPADLAFGVTGRPRIVQAAWFVQLTAQLGGTAARRAGHDRTYDLRPAAALEALS